MQAGKEVCDLVEYDRLRADETISMGGVVQNEANV